MRDPKSRSLLSPPPAVGNSSLRRALIIVAHPDDEAIFFFATIRQLRQKGFLVQVLCATGKFGEQETTRTRLAEFYESCRRCGVQGQSLGLEDRRGRSLYMDELHGRLQAFSSSSFDRVYTHGPWGDYGHLHHAGVCHAVHKTFGEGVLSLAGPLWPESTNVLVEAEHRKKLKHLATCYSSQRFAWSWATKREDFAQLRPAEAIVLTQVALGLEIPSLPLCDGFRRSVRPRVVSGYLHGYSTSIPPELHGVPEKVWRGSIGRFREALWNRAGRLG